MRHRTRLLLALVGVGLAAPAHAGQLIINFSFAGSSITVPGLLSIPPDGSITAGGATLTLQANGPTTPYQGFAGVNNFVLDATADVEFSTILTHVTLYGPLSLSQQGFAFGQFTTPGNVLRVSNGFNLFLFFSIDCSDGIFNGCNQFGVNFPVQSSGTFELDDTLSFALHNLGVVGGATLMNNITATTQSGGTFMFNIVGTEVSRTYVPEPGRALLLASGFGGLAALERLRRARRSR